MIDIENIIFDECAARIYEKYPTAEVSGVDINTSAESPSVVIVEADNTSYEQTADSGSNENHALVMYQVSVTSNNAAGKKAECKDILNIIDNYFANKGFMRIGKEPATIKDGTWFRLVARYRAVISKDNVIYRR